jgi:hypothetical protein
MIWLYSPGQKWALGLTNSERISHELAARSRSGKFFGEMAELRGQPGWILVAD